MGAAASCICNSEVSGTFCGSEAGVRRYLASACYENVLYPCMGVEGVLASKPVKSEECPARCLQTDIGLNRCRVVADRGYNGR
jgi:hypothetical protein